MPSARRARSFFDDDTRGLAPADLQRLLTRDAAEVCRPFTRHVGARHLPRAMRRADGRIERVTGKSGCAPVLGMLPGGNASNHAPLEPGDLFLFPAVCVAFAGAPAAE